VPPWRSSAIIAFLKRGSSGRSGILGTKFTGKQSGFEHVMSEDMEKRIASALGNPDRDPHGEPIPSARLVMPRDASIPLSELMPGQEAMVRRAEAGDSNALRRLDAAGVRIGSVVRVMSRSAYDQLLTLQIRGRSKPVTFGPALTERVYVERTKTK